MSKYRSRNAKEEVVEAKQWNGRGIGTGFREVFDFLTNNRMLDNPATKTKKVV